MKSAHVRAWWWHRQGLDGSLRDKSPAEVLERAGWSRSIGGVDPYLTLFSRARISRADADKDVLDDGSAMDPEALRAATRTASRSLGDEGKKKGVTTTLPLALGNLHERAVRQSWERGADRRAGVIGRVGSRGDW